MFQSRSSLRIALGALLLAAPPLRAQSVAQMLGADVKHGVSDMAYTLGSPLHTSFGNWAMAADGILLAVALSPTDDQVDRWFLSTQKSSVWAPLRVFREGGPAFSGKTITPTAIALYAAGLGANNKSIREGIWGCVASYGAESLVRTEVLYKIVARERPDSVRGNHDESPSAHGDQYQIEVPGGRGWGTHSFPAGHVANVAACASFLSYRFTKRSVVIPANLLAAAVGIGRMVDRRHWSSDTLIGILLGYAIGKEVARRSLEREQPRANQAKGASGAPVLIGWQATF